MLTFGQVVFLKDLYQEVCLDPHLDALLQLNSAMLAVEIAFGTNYRTNHLLSLQVKQWNITVSKVTE